ncbi:MAG: hypothetical protein Q4D89_08730 [Arachnia propionica]|uniref:hypothetical protein n=1 Tax=Arachnia propionica TaxID=1750 RepID=UPI0027101A09|nr:hypothetical protein [Arachnia propionica]
MSGTGHVTGEDTLRRPRPPAGPVVNQDDIPTEEIPGLPILPEATAPGAPQHPLTPVLGEPGPRPTVQFEAPQPMSPEPVAVRRRREMQAYRAGLWRVWFVRMVRFLNRLQLPAALLAPVVVVLHQWVLTGHDLQGWAFRVNAILWLVVVCLLVAGEVTTTGPRWVSLVGAALRSTTIALAGLAFSHVNATSWLPGRIGTELSLPWGVDVPVEPVVGRTVVMALGLVLLLPFLLTIAQGMRLHLDSTTRFGLPHQPSFKLLQVGQDPWSLGIPTTPLVISQYRRRVARFYFGRVVMTLWWLFALAVMVTVATA